MIKTCQSCKADFEPNKRLGPKRISAVKFCSMPCARAAQRKVLPRNCATCEAIFNPSNRRGKYCGKECAAAAHKGPPVTKEKRERYRRVSAPDGTRQLEHRVVMEKIIGRPLLSSEQVHHRNGERFDNDPDNLELWYRGQPTGQRIDDLIAYVVKHHTEAVRLQLQQHLSCLLGEPESLNKEAA